MSRVWSKESRLTSFSDNLLGWYGHHQRSLPWRSDDPNPYHVWLSEIMLQQTTVKTVIPYFLHFIKKWPTLQDLAAASLDDVLVAWQGLGYYSRARNLHKCACEVVTGYGGQFPKDEKQLLTLPGIGPYTAAAISSIVYDQPAAAVDGNVIRVLARYFALAEPRPLLDKRVKEKLVTLLPGERCGDFTQAMMELGALVCRPKAPDCEGCPLQHDCQSIDDPQSLPTPTAKKQLPIRYAVAYFVQQQNGTILLRKRDEKGMLGGMMEVPTTPWLDQKPGANVVKSHAPLETEEWEELEGFVKHTFSHFHFHIYVSRVKVLEHADYNQGEWVHTEDLHRKALPTVMKKVISFGLE